MPTLPSIGDLADDLAQAVESGTLKATDGSFGYDLPAGTDAKRLSERDHLVRASHQFAVASFGA